MATTTATRLQPSQALIQLLTAAVISPRFRTRLLADAQAALAEGYAGTHFQLTQQEVERVVAIRATSLEAFAMQLEAFAPGVAYPIPPALRDGCLLPSEECLDGIPASTLLVGFSER